MVKYNLQVFKQNMKGNILKGKKILNKKEKFALRSQFSSKMKVFNKLLGTKDKCEGQFKSAFVKKGAIKDVKDPKDFAIQNISYRSTEHSLYPVKLTRKDNQESILFYNDWKKNFGGDPIDLT